MEARTYLDDVVSEQLEQRLSQHAVLRNCRCFAPDERGQSLGGSAQLGKRISLELRFLASWLCHRYSLR
jgi:hypothetical protein